MKRFTARLGVFLAIDVLLLLVCLFHLPSVFHRPSAPFEVIDLNARIVISRVTDQFSSGPVLSGDHLITWKGMALPAPEAVEFLADQGYIGEEVPVTIDRGGSVFAASVTLVPFYSSPRFLIISIVVGLIIWMTAVVIVWNAPPGMTSMVLHWTMVAFGVTILITPGAISSDSIMSFVDRTLFFLAYQGVVALFFFFALLYPTQRLRPLLASFTLLPALLLVAGMSILHLKDLATGSLEYFGAFQTLFDLFHVSLFLYTGGAVLTIGASLRTAARKEDLRKLQWIVWGLSIGAAPFLFLHVLPQVLFSRYFMAEEYATIFFLAIPFSFAMSFLKYHFLDIEVLINRSIVYALLSLFVIITFSLTFLLATSAFGTRMVFEEYLALSGVALLFALLFSPVRNRVQHLVDETLFAARADFRSAVRNVSTGLHHVLTSEALFQSLVDRLYGLIPARTMAVYRLHNSEFTLTHRRGETIPDRVSVSLEERNVLAETPLLALPGAVEGMVSGKRPGIAWLERTGCSVCVPLTNDRDDLVGAVVLSPRTERDRFREEEVDLLQTGCSQASEILDRLILQERMILEEEENRRLKELSDLKSYFVSSVSHELRTPLTSIRMFAETLRLGRYSDRRQQREYLKIIEGESGRLGRLIGNVLDFSKIERGVKEYNFGSVTIRSVVKSAVAALKYEFQAARAVLTVSIAKGVPRQIYGDADALEQLLINLLSNALKYSIGKKRARLSVQKTGRQIVVQVSDSGVGISRAELPLIFDKFHRVRDSRMRQVGGAGLGLAIVKHIVESHQGTISVRSTVGKGSTFTLKIPMDFKPPQV